MRKFVLKSVGVKCYNVFDERLSTLIKKLLKCQSIFVLKASKPKPLFVLAHLREAKYFVKNDGLKQTRTNYYLGDDYDLFLTGEGGDQVVLNLGYLLGELSGAGSLLPSCLVNLGVAGGLEPKSIGECVPVQTCYGFRGNQPLFKSFSFEHPPQSSSLKWSDCLSVDQRIRSEQTLHEIELQFPLVRVVDQELWWVCYVADRFKLPVFAWKMVSDLVSDQRNDQELVRRIRKNHFQLEKLWELVQSDFFKERIRSENNRLDPYPWENDRFYLTTSQKMILEQQVGKIEQMSLKKGARDELLKTIDWASLEESWEEKKFTPKQKTQFLLARLEQMTQKMSSKYRQEIDRLILKCQKKNDLMIKYDPKLEKKEIAFTFTATSIEEFNQKQDQLEKLSRQDYLRNLFLLYTGELDLE